MNAQKQYHLGGIVILVVLVGLLAGVYVYVTSGNFWWAFAAFSAAGTVTMFLLMYLLGRDKRTYSRKENPITVKE